MIEGSGSEKTATLAVLGLGHVGLPTALGLAELGWEVAGADEAAEKIDLLKSGKAPFYEPGLQPLLEKHLVSGRFKPTGDVAAAVRSASVIFVCVGTPQRENGAPDLSQVEAVARVIARNLNGYKLIVEKSTVPAITARWIKRTIERFARFEEQPGGGAARKAEPAGGAAFEVASNPEFLQEGKAIHDFFHPDRIVIGVESESGRAILEEIYRPINCPLVVTTPTTAELIKHAANAFLATKISFINMVSDLCDAVGADVEQVAHGLGLDPRIGAKFLSAGIGFGGYCFPKDLRAFIHLAETHGVECTMLRGAELVNQQRTGVVVKKLRDALWVIQGKTLAVLGLAFKPHTDDIREAPSLKIIDALLKEGASLRLYDPQAMPAAKAAFAKDAVTFCASAYEAATGAAALLILTDWEEFAKLDLVRTRSLMEVPVIVDGRNVLDPAAAREAGFEYLCMGRAEAASSAAREKQGTEAHLATPVGG
ncbi:MAG: UDP-glucose dehydrogenase family protein [Terriglobia bacterium]